MEDETKSIAWCDRHCDNSDCSRHEGNIPDVEGHKIFYAFMDCEGYINPEGQMKEIKWICEHALKNKCLHLLLYPHAKCCVCPPNYYGNNKNGCAVTCLKHSGEYVLCNSYPELGATRKIVGSRPKG